MENRCEKGLMVGGREEWRRTRGEEGGADLMSMKGRLGRKRGERMDNKR